MNRNVYIVMQGEHASPGTIYGVYESRMLALRAVNTMIHLAKPYDFFQGMRRITTGDIWQTESLSDWIEITKHEVQI